MHGEHALTKRLFGKELKELSTWFQEGRLKPHISVTYPLERAAEVLNEMMNRNVKGKIVLIP